MFKIKKFYLFITLFTVLMAFKPQLSAQEIDKPKISIIVPVYNTEKYLDECIDSLESQTLEDLEMIFIDDGSADNSLNILNKRAEKNQRIKVIHQENQGAALARQTGIDAAKGEYIKFVDSDDILEKNACELCYNEAKKYDADIVVHNIYIFTKDCKWKNYSYNGNEKHLITDQMFTPLCVSLWAHLYKTSFIKENDINFRNICSMGEDVYFNKISYPTAKKIVTIPDYLYSYRVDNKASLMHTVHGENNSLQRINNFNETRKFYSKRGYFEKDFVRKNFLIDAISLYDKNMSKDTLKKLADSLGGSELINKETISLLSNYEKSILFRIYRSKYGIHAKF
ncbi:MAG: glycosyltransferase family 2 protein [Acutalibacteraceae bacterium]